MAPNARWQFVLVYTEPAGAKAQAVEDVTPPSPTAPSGSARRPACRCTTSRWRRPPPRTRPCEDGAVGKVLITTSDA